MRWSNIGSIKSWPGRRIARDRVDCELESKQPAKPAAAARLQHQFRPPLRQQKEESGSSFLPVKK